MAFNLLTYTSIIEAGRNGMALLLFGLNQSDTIILLKMAALLIGLLLEGKTLAVTSNLVVNSSLGTCFYSVIKSPSFLIITRE